MSASSSGTNTVQDHPSTDESPKAHESFSWPKTSPLGFLNANIVPVNGAHDGLKDDEVLQRSCIPACIPLKKAASVPAVTKDNYPPSDLKLLVFGKELAVHRSILRKSPYFFAMLDGPWKESQADKISITIEDPNITLDSFMLAIDYLYGKEIQIAPHQPYQLLAVSSMLQLDSLSLHCVGRIAQTLGPHTIIDAAEFAIHYCQPTLLEATFRWLKRHLSRAGHVTKQKLSLLPKPAIPCAWAMLEGEAISGAKTKFGSAWLRRSCAEAQPPLHTLPVCPHCDLVLDGTCIMYHNRKLPLSVYNDLIAGDNLRKSRFERPEDGPDLRQCYIKRTKDEKNSALRRYYLYTQQGDALLVAKKRRHSKTSEFVICMNTNDTSRHGASYIGCMRSNFLGTQYSICDKGINPEEIDPSLLPFPERTELAAIFFQVNLLGVRGPRKMTVMMPRLNEDNTWSEFRSGGIAQSVRQHQTPNLIVLRNKAPLWSDQLNAYTLNFFGRVKMASKKNFQLIMPENPDQIVLMFGKVDSDTFALDYRHPLSCLQAFCIALSSFDHKLAVS